MEQKTVIIKSPAAREQARICRQKRKRRVIWTRIGLLAICLILAVAAILLPGTLKRWAEADLVETSAVIPAGDIEMPQWVTQELLTQNRYSRPGTALTSVNGFVIHNTGNPGTTAEQNRSYFEGLAQTGITSASSHFIIGIDGEVLQCVPLDEVAYASNFRNNDTISIEICHADETGEFTDDTYQSLIRLLFWLCDTYALSSNTIIRHGDIIDKNCPKYYMENLDKWEYLLNDVVNYKQG